MPRKRAIQAAEASIWLPALLDHCFSENVAQKSSKLDLLNIAYDATAYPDDIPVQRLAELLLLWAEKYVNAEDWQRLQSRVRKRRSRSS